MASEENIKENFKKNLKANEYHEQIHTEFERMKILFEVIMSFIHDVVKSRRFVGNKLLEIGSGATVHNIASASAYYSAIVQSDFVDDNCETLRRWHKMDSPLDWSEFLSVAARLEDCRSDVKEVIEKMESRIRSNVKAVVHCDILKDGILQLEEVPASAAPPYDLIISVLCLEVPCSDFESFVNVLKRVNKLLRKGGGLVMSSLINTCGWAVGEAQFPNLKIDVKSIVSALDKAGFGNHDVKTFSKIFSSYEIPFDGFYCIATEKL